MQISAITFEITQNILNALLAILTYNFLPDQFNHKLLLITQHFKNIFEIMYELQVR